MHPVFRWTIALALVGAGVGWVLTRPASLTDTELAALEAAKPEVAQGEQVFWAAGCASCHTAPGSEASDTPQLAGGQAFKTQFGTFYAPNISPHPEVGIGGWTLSDFATAVKTGVSPGGAHYYPAFPYAAYKRMDEADVAALHAFMQTLPPDETANTAHEISFPFNIRRSVGGWKLLFLNDGWMTDADTPELERGRYIVEALAHCGECHTPRNALGGLDSSAWLAGGPNPNGEGRIPGITPAQLDWSPEDIAYYLTTGFTPDFDSAGGHMAEVVSNMARLPESDIAAIVAYLKALP